MSCYLFHARNSKAVSTAGVKIHEKEFDLGKYINKRGFSCQFHVYDQDSCGNRADFVPIGRPNRRSLTRLA